MPLLILVPLHIVLAPAVVAARAAVLLPRHPAPPRLVRVVRPHVPVQVLGLGAAAVAQIAPAALGVVVHVFAGRGGAYRGGRSQLLAQEPSVGVLLEIALSGEALVASIVVADEGIVGGSGELSGWWPGLSSIGIIGGGDGGGGGGGSAGGRPISLVGIPGAVRIKVHRGWLAGQCFSGSVIGEWRLRSKGCVLGWWKRGGIRVLSSWVKSSSSLGHGKVRETSVEFAVVARMVRLGRNHVSGMRNLHALGETGDR